MAADQVAITCPDCATSYAIERWIYDNITSVYCPTCGRDILLPLGKRIEESRKSDG